MAAEKDGVASDLEDDGGGALMDDPERDVDADAAIVCESDADPPADPTVRVNVVDTDDVGNNESEVEEVVDSELLLESTVLDTDADMAPDGISLDGDAVTVFARAVGGDLG